MLKIIILLLLKKNRTTSAAHSNSSAPLGTRGVVHMGHGGHSLHGLSERPPATAAEPA
jgi:hypothetical protein